MEHILREIEKELSLFPSRVIEHSTLVAILQKLQYKNYNDKISRLKSQGILTPLKRGIYLYHPLKQSNFSKENIANLLMGPSYVSLDYALSYWGIIPERVYTITSVSTKRFKLFQTPNGVFEYHKIPTSLFGFGVEIEKVDQVHYLIASKEKALCDKVFLTKNIGARNLREMLEFLQEDLRVDLEEFAKSDLQIFEKYLHITRSKKIMLLKRVIEELR